jgi:hypothetical protein
MTAALVLAAMAVCASPASGQALGTIDFPTSGSPGAQQPFIRGVLFMHSFEYPNALAEFQKAEKLDSGFAMAYWDRVVAAEAYTDLASVWRHADADVPGLAEVRQNGGVGATK